MVRESFEMKEKYLDKYGNDSLVHLKIASENHSDFFATSNELILEDREELELLFNIKIRTAYEMLTEMDK